jgi:hypothetical protein
MASTVAVLFVFGGLLWFLYDYSEGLKQQPASGAGERQLRELQAAERDMLETYGHVPAARPGGQATWRIPIDRAIETLAAEGNATGELKSFPARKQR